MDKKVIILIPARKNSKRLPNKNMKQLCGHPLIHYQIETALKVKNIDDIYVNTDDENIITYCQEKYKDKIKIYQRKEELATDHTTMLEVVLDFVDNIDCDYLILLQPTSPLLDSKYIEEGLDRLNLDKDLEPEYHPDYVRVKHYQDTCISVSEERGFYWDREENRNERERTQDMKPQIKENGSFYILRASEVKKNKQFFNFPVGFIYMPKKESFEIDTEEDFEIVEAMMEHNKRKKEKEHGKKAKGLLDDIFGTNGYYIPDDSDNNGGFGY